MSNKSSLFFGYPSSSALRSSLIVTMMLAMTIGAVSLALSWRDNKRAQMRAADLPITIRQAQPLIAAIERYRKERGELPNSISGLVPKYLRRIPDAGPVAEDGWHYDLTNQQETGDWTLSVRVRDEYSPSVMGFGDTFAFHRSEKYPQKAYGGVLIPFGKWGYYME